MRKKYRINSISKRLLSWVLCLCCCLPLLVPILELRAYAEEPPTVSLEWKAGTSMINGAAYSSDGKLTLVVRLSGNADGVVKVGVSTFNLSSDSKDYESFAKTVVLSNEKRTVEIPVTAVKTYQRRKGELVTKIDGVAYERQFGIHIYKVENAERAVGKNTLRAYIAQTGTTKVTVVKNSSVDYYDEENEAGYLPEGYVYDGFQYSWSKSLSIGTAQESSSAKIGFNVYDVIGSNNVKKIYNASDSVNIYYRGSGVIDDKALGWVGGFTFTIHDGNDTDNVYFRGKRTDNMNFDNTSFNWLEFGYDSDGISVGKNDRISAYNRTSKKTVQVLKAKTHEVAIDFYNHSGHAKKYLSDFKVQAFMADVTAPQVVDYSVGYSLIGKNETAYIMVQFDKPVQVDPAGKDIKGNPVTLGLKTLVNGKTVTFNYVDGSFTDTLIFAADLEGEMVSSTIDVLEFVNCYSLGNGGVRIMDLTWNTGNQNNLFTAPKGTVSKPLAQLAALVDTRDPRISLSSCSTADQTARAHTVNVSISNIEPTGAVYYAWSQSANATDVSRWTRVYEFNNTGSNAFEGSGFTGDYYLHVRAENMQGQITYWVSPQSYSFDNTPISVEQISCDYPDAAADHHELALTVKADDMATLACVYLYVKDASGQQLVTQKEIYNRASVSGSRLIFTDNVGRIELTAADVGVSEGDYRWVAVGFELLDIYGNRSTSPAYSRQIIYDNRKGFKAEIEEAPERELNGYDVYVSNDNTYTVVFDPLNGGNGEMPINVYGIYSIKRNGVTIYDVSNPSNNGGMAYTLDSLKEYDIGQVQVKDLLEDLLTRDGWLDGKTAADHGFDFSFSDSAGTRLEMTVSSEAKGFYEFVYFANGKRAEAQLFFTGGADDTENFVQLSESLLSNEVWKFTTNKFYSFVVTDGGSSGNISYNISGSYYAAKGSAYPIFSSREKAYEYALFTELQDVTLVYLDESMSSVADMLNGAGSSGNFTKAAGETTTATVGQTWIRYKSEAWSPDVTASAQHWVYYYYSGTRETSIDINRIFVSSGNTLLGRALENNAKDICGYDGGYTYLTKNNSAVTSDGAPTYNRSGIFDATLTYSGQFSEPIVYEGDRAIYNSAIRYPWGGSVLEGVILTANYEFTSSDGATTIYYRLYEGENNAALYESVRIGKGETVELKSIITASGLYEIIETGNGYRKFCIYVDYDAPVVEYEYVRAQNTFAGYVDEMLHGTTVRGAQITVKSILTHANGSYTVEYDPQAYVYVTNMAGTSVMGFATLAQLASGEELQIPEGDYKLHVYDRLGNHVVVSIRTNSETLEIDGQVNASGDALVVNVNRQPNEIESFTVTKNGMAYDTAYASTMRFYQNGIYEITIKDIYGDTRTETLELNRALPSIEIQYRNENGVFVPLHEATSGNAFLQILDDGVYQVVSSSDIKIKYLNNESYAVTATAGNPTITPAMLGGSVTITDNDGSGWTVQVALSNDPTTYVTITCGYDKEAPQIGAYAEKPAYSFFEEKGSPNVLFSQTGSQSVPLNNGAKLYATSVTFSWQDQNPIGQVCYYKDGVRYAITEEAFAAGSVTFTEEGEYEVFVTDIINNTASYKVTITKELALEYFVGGVQTDYHKNPSEAIANGVFSYTQKTGKEITLVLGEPANLAFMYSNGGASYTYQLYYDGSGVTVFVYDYLASVLVDSYRTEEGSTSGILFRELPCPVKPAYSLENGQVTLTIPACTTAYEILQMRISDDSVSYPYVIQIERSNTKPDVSFVKQGDTTPLDTNETTYVGVNTAVEILRESVDASVRRIVAYYSAEYTVSFDACEMFTLYDGSELSSVSDEGYYKIVVENAYGNEQIAYIRIGYGFTVSADVTYDSGEKLGYTFTDGSYRLYTNGSAKLYVWVPTADCTVTATMNGSPYVPALIGQDDGFSVEITRVGEYVFSIKEFCGHEIAIAVSVKAPVEISYNDYLEGFNRNALYGDRDYTNEPLDIRFDSVTADGIGRIRYVYTRNGIAETQVVLYDRVSANPVGADEAALKGCIGREGNGIYTVYFMDLYGNEVSKTVYVSKAEQLIIHRLIQLDATEQGYALTDAMAQGVWSNRSIILKDLAAASLLKVNGETVSFTDGVYRFDFPANMGQGHETYEVEYTDEYGNRYAFTVHLYRKVPEVALPAGTAVLEDNGSVYVKGAVSYVWSDPNVTATYTLQGGETTAYAKGQVLTAEGTYVFTFTDLAGNVAVRTLKYDAGVDYKLVHDLGEVNSGIATNGSITIRKDGEEIRILTVKRDGEEIQHESMTFSAHGYYEVTLGDRIGNQTVVCFYIITHAFNQFTYTAESGYAITDVWFTVDGFKLSYVGDVTVDAEGRQSYTLNEVGTYELVITEIGSGRAYEFTVSIDRTPPAVSLVGVENGGTTRESVSLSGVEIGDLVEVYRNGELIFSRRATSKVVDPPSIESWGDFRIVVSDEAGNSVEFTFRKEFSTNLASNVIILMMMSLVVAGAFLYLYLGKKVKVK